MASNLDGNCWEMVSGNPEAQETLRVLIRDNPLCDDWRELSAIALALAGD